MARGRRVIVALILLTCGFAAGLVITEISPLRDPDGTLLERLLDPLTSALAAAS